MKSFRQKKFVRNRNYLEGKILEGGKGDATFVSFLSLLSGLINSKESWVMVVWNFEGEVGGWTCSLSR